MTFLDSESLRFALALRVGADVVEPHICHCDRKMSARGLQRLCDTQDMLP